MLALFYLELFLVQPSQMLDLLHTFTLNFVFLSLNHTILLIVMRFLTPNLCLELLDFILVSSQLVFSLLLMSILVHFNVVLQTFDVGL